jgi:hypothetical protein
MPVQQDYGDCLIDSDWLSKLVNGKQFWWTVDGCCDKKAIQVEFSWFG